VATAFYEREEWDVFSSLTGLARKAGVAQDRLAEVVVKELTDNALDVAGDCELSLRGPVLVVRDRGGGFPGNDEAIARFFSTNRPETSSKFERLPTRGCLGVGLKVVAGAVAATGGQLLVSTRGRTLKIVPDLKTGRSAAVRVGGFREKGTKIQVPLGKPLQFVPDDLNLARIAIHAAHAPNQRGYSGKTSPHWCNLNDFCELLRSLQSGEITIRDFVRQKLDGCSDPGTIVEGLAGRAARSLTRRESDRVLRRAKETARPVKPQRLGYIGEGAFAGVYAREAGFVTLPPSTDGSRVELPVVTEAWADSRPEDSNAVLLINRTPSVADVNAWYSPKDKSTRVHGPELYLKAKTGKTGISLCMSIITPFMPVTSDGKSPALSLFNHLIETVVEKVARRVRQSQPRGDRALNIKTVVLAHMEEGIREASGDRRLRFHWRQVLYRLRPIVMNRLGLKLQDNYFNQLVTEYEAERGEEQKAYRDPRGTLYLPHTGDTIPLGTLQVEDFSRPEWQFNKLIYIEKEGFSETLKDAGFAERHDCAIMSAKGFSTRAARDMIDRIGESSEPVIVFCIHDCDAPGTMIYQSLQEATPARPRRAVEIVNLGLDPEEAVALAEQGIVETEDPGYDNRQPVADYVDDRWADWLQSHRVELNAFTSPQFIAWLDGKMAAFSGKVIPPAAILAERLESGVRKRVRESITKRVLAEARVDDQVDRAMAELGPRMADVTAELPGLVAADLHDDPRRHWTETVAARAENVAEEL
jgi:hypothetical protein